MFDFFSGPFDSRQTTRLMLLAIIMLTLPCYCLGAVLLAYAPDETPTTRAPATNPTLGGSTELPALTATYTPFRTLTHTSTPLGGPLQATPPQIYLPTSTPFSIVRTNTPFVTNTPLPTITSAPSLTIAPSATLAPTSIPTNTLAPTNTAVPTSAPLPTNTPVPTNVPAATVEPAPTQETLPGLN